MLKIKDDVPLINLIDMGFVKGVLSYYNRKFNNDTVIIDSDKRIWYFSEKVKDFIQIKMYDHCIRDLVRKGYVEEIK